MAAAEYEHRWQLEPQGQIPAHGPLTPGLPPGCDWSAPDRLEALQEAVLGLLLPAPGADLWKTSAVWDYLELLCGSNGPRGTAALLFAR